MASQDIDAHSRSNSVGHVVAAHGSVLDIAFPEGTLAAIHEALAIDWDRGSPLTAEIEQHLDPTTVRTVALQGTGGLKRGTLVRRLDAPLQVPVGEAVLGRLLNVAGDVTDMGPPLPPDLKRRSIHAAAPSLQHQGTARSRFHTGIKAIDLLAPLITGGKAAMFGGAGVGKTVLIMELI
jgi:F-type H+-transporting ATPase subunit beta